MSAIAVEDKEERDGSEEVISREKFRAQLRQWEVGTALEMFKK